MLKVIISCATCHLDERFCPGHFGHIMLPQPVYHPLVFKTMMTLLKATCVYCHHFRLKGVEVHRYACKLKLLSRGLVLEAQAVDEVGRDASAILQKMDVDAKEGEDSASDRGNDDDETVVERLIKKREKFVRASLQAEMNGHITREDHNFCGRKKGGCERVPSNARPIEAMRELWSYLAHIQACGELQGV